MMRSTQRRRFGAIAGCAVFVAIAAICGCDDETTSSGGVLLWSRADQGGAVAGANGVAACQDGTLRAALQYSGVFTLDAGTAGEAAFDSAPGGDVLVVKLAPGGAIIWRRLFSGTSDIYAMGIDCGPDGECAVVFASQNDVAIEDGTGGSVTLATTSPVRLGLAVFSSDGELQHAALIGGDSALSLCVRSDGSLAMLVSASAYTVFGIGDSDPVIVTTAGMYAVTYEADGSLSWVVPIPFTAEGMASGPDDSLAIVGSFFGSIVVGPGEQNETPLTSNGDDDLVVARFDATGALLWARAEGGALLDWANGVDVAPDGRIFVAGESGGMTIDAGGPREATVSPVGARDAYVAQFGSDSGFSWMATAGPATFSGFRHVAATGVGVAVAGVTPGVPLSFYGSDGSSMTVSSDGGFCAMYDGGGRLLWLDAIETEKSMIVYDMAAAPDGTVVVGGRTDSPAIVHTAAGAITITDDNSPTALLIGLGQ